MELRWERSLAASPEGEEANLSLKEATYWCPKKSVGTDVIWDVKAISDDETKKD